MKIMDEDYGYERERQRRVDEGKVQFGKALIHADRIPKYERHDPAPHLPFQEDIHQLPKWQEALLWAAPSVVIFILYWAFK